MPPTLHSLIHRKIVVLSPKATLLEAARAMCDNMIGCVLVAGTEGGIGGIVTDRDLSCRWLTEEGLGAVADAQASVEQLMSRHLITASENDGLNDIVQLMENYGVRRIPIVHTDPHAPPNLQQQELQKHQRFVGIVTLDDLLAAELVTLHHVARIVRRQFRRKLEDLGHAYPVSPTDVASTRTLEGKALNRSAAHQAQTLQRFYSYMSEATGLSLDLLPQVTYFIVGALITRVTLSTAMHFLVQLPELLRDPLLVLPLGPDRAVSARKLTEEMVENFQFTETYARNLLHTFIAAVGAWVSPGTLDHLRSQLPGDFHVFFEPIVVSPADQPLPQPATMDLTSAAFEESGEMPKKYTGEGGDRSPPLAWSDVPKGTKEFALLCEDPDAHGETPWVHWVIFGISPSQTQLPEGLPATARIEAPIRAIQGTGTSGDIGYQGPMPPKKDSWHRYFFRLYALDRELSLRPGATALELREEMKDHILAEGCLMGRYRRAQRKAVA